MDVQPFGAIQPTTVSVASTQTVTAIPTQTPIGQPRRIVTGLTHSQSTQHNGAMKTTMGLVAMPMETMQTIVQTKQVPRLRTRRDALIVTVMAIPTQAIHSLMTAPSGKTLMEITTGTILTETTLTSSPMMLLSGVMSTVMDTGTTLAETTAIDSPTTQHNGPMLTTMALATILLTTMAMESPKGIPTCVRKPMANPSQRLLVDARTPMVTDTPTLRTHSRINRFSGRIKMGMVTETMCNLQTAMSASTYTGRAPKTESKGALIPMAMAMPTRSETSLQSLIVPALMHSPTILSNGAIKTAMGSVTITRASTRR